MLVLSRKRNEWIDIGEGVSITVVDIRGDKVRIGIEAPREMAVHRREVTELLADKRFAEETAAMAAWKDGGE